MQQLLISCNVAPGDRDKFRDSHIGTHNWTAFTTTDLNALGIPLGIQKLVQDEEDDEALCVAAIQKETVRGNKRGEVNANLAQVPFSYAKELTARRVREPTTLHTARLKRWANARWYRSGKYVHRQFHSQM